MKCMFGKRNKVKKLLVQTLFSNALISINLKKCISEFYFSNVISTEITK